MADVTHLLFAAAAGDPQAAAELLPLVYDELRKLAAARMASEALEPPLPPAPLLPAAPLGRGGAPAGGGGAGGALFSAGGAGARRPLLAKPARRKKRLRHGGGLRRGDLPADGPAITSP